MIQPPTFDEAVKDAKERLGSIDKTIDQIKEDFDDVIAGKGRPSERSHKRDVGFVVKGIMNVEESYNEACQICRRLPLSEKVSSSEDILDCIYEISKIRDESIEKITDILSKPLR